jgi:hypothetical protein
MSIVAACSGVLLSVLVVCSAQTSLALSLTLGYSLLVTILCLAVIGVLLGELVCRVLDGGIVLLGQVASRILKCCIPILRRLTPLSRLYHMFVLITCVIAALTSMGVQNVWWTNMPLQALGCCVFSVAVIGVLLGELASRMLDYGIVLLVVLAYRTLAACIAMFRRLTPLSRMYSIMARSTDVLLDTVVALFACGSVMLVLAAEAGPGTFMVAAGAVGFRPWNARCRPRASARSQETKVKLLKAQKRMDKHKNSAQRKRGKQWISQNWSHETATPALVHVSIQHPDVGPFRFETTFPVTGTINDFLLTTGLAAAVVKTWDSHTMLIGVRTFADYGFLPGSVITLHATFMQHPEGLLGGATCEFISEGGSACQEPTADGVYCLQHAHPLREIVQLGDECDRLDTVASLGDMQARAQLLLDKLNALALPDEPLALTGRRSTLSSFTRLRQLRREQLTHALQLQESVEGTVAS